MPPSSAHRPLPGSIRHFKKSTVGRKIFFPTVFFVQEMPILRTKLSRKQLFVQENTLFCTKPSAPQLPVQKSAHFCTKLCLRQLFVQENTLFGTELYAPQEMVQKDTLFDTETPPATTPGAGRHLFHPVLQHFAPGCSLICKTLILRLNLKIIGYG